MKRLFTAVCCLLLAMACWVATAQENTMMTYRDMKIMVISDPHVLAPSLAGDGKAARHLASSDVKMVLSSDFIVEKMMEQVALQRPDLLLISGDLTFNGALASHERLVGHLAHLEKAGVRTLVIPGNHDINCPYSKSFTGDEAKPVATVSSEEFVQLYSRCGYGADSNRDPNSLSYTIEIAPGLVLLCIDSNRYDSNRLSPPVEYHNDGAIKGETMEWIKRRLAAAQSSGKRVVAMMHHHLVEHIDGEAKLLPNYIVAEHDKVAQALRDGGVKVIFTGHLHITDAAAAGGLVDIATGSATTYPFPMREVTIDGKTGTLMVKTQFLDNLGDSLMQEGRLKIENSAAAIAGLVSRRLWPKVGSRLGQLTTMLGIDEKKMPGDAQALAALMTRHLRQPLAQSLLAVTRGGEDPHQAAAIIEAVKQGVRSMVCELIPNDGDMVANFIIEEFMPRVEPMLRSALEDVNQVGTSQESRTHDHELVVGF